MGESYFKWSNWQWINLPHASAGKESASSAGDPGSISGLGRSSVEGNGYPLHSSEKESEIVVLKLNVQKMKIMAYSPITSWQKDGETVETVSDFILGCSKITVDGDCSMKLKNAFSFEEKLWPT